MSRRIDVVAEDPLSDLYQAHVADYQSLYRRFRIDLGKTAQALAEKPTDARLLAYDREKTDDPDLEELLVNYGRYLLISSSRPGSMPANLQGLWNDKSNPPWRSDYHSNINVKLNYWPSEPTNLAECQKPFLKYVLSQVPIYRQRTREEYTATKRGWTVRTENGVFGGGSFKWNPPGSAWYAQHFWEHYAFGQDKDYLRNDAYPLLNELFGFWEDRLVERPDGTLVTPLGWSPEHGPEEEAITYDIMIVHDLFSNYIDGGTGWSRAWKINFWARFQDGDHAYLMLRNLMTAVNTVGIEMNNGAGVYPNLLDAHPPFDLINDAVRDELAEDAGDLALFDERADEPTMKFEDFVKGLKRDGTI